MNQKSLAKWLKIILVGIVLCGLVVYLVVIPIAGNSIVKFYTAGKACYYPWLAVIWITGIPCFVAVLFGWKIAGNIGKNQSFSFANGKLLKWIAGLAAGDAAFFFVANIVLLLFGMNHPSIVLFSIIIVFCGVAISVASAVLSHLVNKAAELQEQSDLTI